MDKKEIYRIHDEEKYGIYKWKAAHYYDYPDGEDLLGKLSFTTKIAFVTSSFFGLLYSIQRPMPLTIQGKLFRVARFVAPAVGIAATFTVVTYYSTVLRKKDDPLNYGIGGFAAGLLVGPALGIPAASLWGILFFSSGGMAKKACQLEGKKLFPPFKTQWFSSYYTRKLDTSMMPEIKGNWTK